MQKTSKNKSTPKLAIHPRLKKSRYSRIFKINYFFTSNSSVSTIFGIFPIVPTLSWDIIKTPW